MYIIIFSPGVVTIDKRLFKIIKQSCCNINYNYAIFIEFPNVSTFIGLSLSKGIIYFK